MRRPVVALIVVAVLVLMLAVSLSAVADCMETSPAGSWLSRYVDCT